VSASVNLPLHHKVQKFSSGTGSAGWSRKKGRKMAVVWLWYHCEDPVQCVVTNTRKYDRGLHHAMRHELAGYDRSHPVPDCCNHISLCSRHGCRLPVWIVFSSSVTQLIISILSQIRQQKPACCPTSQTVYVRRTMFYCVQPNRLQHPARLSRGISELSKELLICTLLTFSDAIQH